MLKKKLSIFSNTNEEINDVKRKKNDEEQPKMQIITTSELFSTPLWKQFFDLECLLNAQLNPLIPPENVKFIYNPLEYAAELHCAYLRRYLTCTKRVVFVGMNPGPNGMAQTGIPFGNVRTVREFMGISGTVGQPPAVHPKRPVAGLNTTIEEPSGVRIWTLLKELAGGSLDTFAQQCFVHNFCPLVFYDKNGRNLTPSDLKAHAYKTQIRDLCLATLDSQLDLLHAEILVAVGEYVFSSFKKSKHINKLKVLRLPHPSPRSLNNTNWPEKAEVFFKENELLKYIQNKL